MLEWLTLWPTWTPLPVTGHLRAMGTSFNKRRRNAGQNAARGHWTRLWGRAPAVSRPAAARGQVRGSDAALVPGPAAQHQPHHGQHDRDLDQDADDGRQRRARLKAEEGNRRGNRQLEEIGGAD